MDDCQMQKTPRRFNIISIHVQKKKNFPFTHSLPPLYLFMHNPHFTPSQEKKKKKKKKGNVIVLQK